MSMTSIRRALAALGVAVLLTACGTPAVPPKREDGGAGRQDPLSLVGAWHVTAKGESPGTALLLGGELAGLVLFRRCGAVDGEWRADSGGTFLAAVDGGDSTCGSKTGIESAPWLEHATGFRTDAADRLLLDASGKVLARLTPGARPTVNPNRTSDFASPPQVTAALREEMADPAPLPTGVQPATAATLGGRWAPISAPTGMGKAFVRFGLDRRWTGSDGCNGVGGRFALGEEGALLTTSGASTLIGCDNSPVGSWVAQARRAGIDGTTLVLYDGKGHFLGRCRRS